MKCVICGRAFECNAYHVIPARIFDVLCRQGEEGEEDEKGRRKKMTLTYKTILKALFWIAVTLMWVWLIGSFIEVNIKSMHAPVPAYSPMNCFILLERIVHG